MKIMPAIFVLFLAAPLPAFAENKSLSMGVESSRISDGQHFQVSFSSKLDPITINTMHAWILHIENRSGEPVIDARIRISGGMPKHDHGLPTRPLVTQNLGNGDYLLEGLKFHMGGQWQVILAIQQGAVSDSVTFELNL